MFYNYTIHKRQTQAAEVHCCR